jgi:hypothetical protein
VSRGRVSFQLCADIAVIVDIKHDDLGLLRLGCGNRGGRVGDGDAESGILQDLEMRVPRRAVMDEQGDGVGRVGPVMASTMA